MMPLSSNPDSETPVVVVADAVAVADERDHHNQQHQEQPQQQHQQQQPHQQVIVYGHLGRYSCQLQCPFCESLISTRVRERSDGMTILFVILLLFFFWPLFWLPFCMPTCKSVHHYCPNCNNKIGVTDPCN